MQVNCRKLPHAVAVAGGAGCREQGSVAHLDGRVGGACDDAPLPGQHEHNAAVLRLGDLGGCVFVLRALSGCCVYVMGVCALPPRAA